MKYIVASDSTLLDASTHLTSVDPILAPLIAQSGLCTIRPHTDYYRQLVRSIVGQQLSVRAAAAINTRFLELFDGTFPEPQAILATSPEELRAVGFSGAKVRYVQDLALHISNGTLNFSNFDDLSNEEVIHKLTPVKGIGEWTAHMFLMFCMGRLDVLPVGDLGIRSAIRNLYGFESLPSPDQIRELSVQRNWHPYESVASWYLWRSLENEPIS